MKKITLITGAVIGAALLITSGCRHHGLFHSSFEKRSAKIVEKIADELSLNPSQEAALIAIKDDIIVMKNESQKSHLEAADVLIKKIEDNTLDSGEIMQTVEARVQEKLTDVEPVVEKSVLWIQSLSDEQRAKFVEKLKEIREKVVDRCQ